MEKILKLSAITPSGVIADISKKSGAIADSNVKLWMASLAVLIDKCVA